MLITVTITAWVVPFDQMVIDQAVFGGEDAAERALVFINNASKAWWDAAGGDRCVALPADDVHKAQPYEPIKEVGYDVALYELWGGESGFHAMIDRESYAILHEAHYKREFDDQGLDRPGYLIVAEAFGKTP